MGDYPEKGIQISFLIKAPAVATVLPAVAKLLTSL